MICLDALGAETWVRGAPLITRCSHSFHSMCLRKHIRAHSQHGEMTSLCPNCRAPDPLQGARHFGATGSLLATLDRDTQSQVLEAHAVYRIVAILCQDPEA